MKDERSGNLVIEQMGHIDQNNPLGKFSSIYFKHSMHDDVKCISSFLILKRYGQSYLLIYPNTVVDNRLG